PPPGPRQRRRRAGGRGPSSWSTATGATTIWRIEVATSRRLSEKEWDAIVGGMVARGAHESDAEVQAIVEDLGKTLRGRGASRVFWRKRSCGVLGLPAFGPACVCTVLRSFPRRVLSVVFSRAFPAARTVLGSSLCFRNRLRCIFIPGVCDDEPVRLDWSGS